MDDDWQVMSVTVATPELIEPLLAGRVAELNRVVVVEHEETRVSVVRVCWQGGEQKGPLEPFREVAGQRSQAPGLGGCEGTSGLTEQGDPAPRTGIGDECSTQFVAEPVGSPELALPQAAVEVSLGRRAQARRRLLCAGELGELVVVVLGDLDLGHAWHRRRR
jgi:hypothetical protein